MANLLPPIKLNTTPGAEQNTITFEPGPPNEYFDGDLSNWTINVLNGNPTAEISGGTLLLDIPDVDPGTIQVAYDYLLSNIEDFILTVDVPDYNPDNVNDGINTGLRIYSEDMTDFVKVGFFQDTSTRWKVNGYAYINGSVVEDTWVDCDTIRLTKLRIKLVGTTFYYYYYRNDTWVQITSYDAGSTASDIKKVILTAFPRAGYGGSVNYDNLNIIPENYYFSNDLFNNLDNWNQETIHGTISLVSDSVRLDVDDGYSDGVVFLTNKYSISQGNFEIITDIINYVADDNSNGVKGYFKVNSNDNVDVAQIRYNIASGGSVHEVWSFLNVNSDIQTETVYPSSRPSKLKLSRVGNILYTHYYIDSWILIDSRDFSDRSSNISSVVYTCSDESSRGGYIEFDNLVLDKGIDSYNLYWKKDKVPNCYFNNLDDWTLTTNDVGETAEIVNNKLVCDVPDGVDGLIRLDYDYRPQNEDFAVELDIFEYTPDSLVNGFQVVLGLHNDPTEEDLVWIKLSIDNSTIKVRTFTKINGVIYDDTDIVGSYAQKLKIERNGTYVNTYYDLGSGYIQNSSRDFGSRVYNMDLIRITNWDYVNRGGSVIIDNLIITPLVKDDYDGVINDIIDLTYDHASLDAGDIYCYEVTSVEDEAESAASEETFGIPLPAIPDPPGNIGITAGIEELTVSWDDSTGVIDTYNLYWKKDKVPNCYFYNDDNFTYSVGTGGSTAQIINNAMHLEVPDGNNGGISAYYMFDVPNEDFVATVDIADYSPDSLTSGANISLKFRTNPNPPDGTYGVYIWYGLVEGTRRIRTSQVMGGVTTLYDTSGIANEPTKFRIERNGTYLITSYYMNDTWIEHQSLDFGTNFDIPHQLQLCIIDNNLHGGSVDFDNLIITPSVKDSGTKISDIVDLHYDHTSLDAGDIYCYEVTSVEDEAESAASEETFGIPEALPCPTEISVDNGEELNTITFTQYSENTDTNIYWSNSPGVTQETGNKISDVSSPYTHSSLNPSLTYYYVLTTESELSESVDSSEYNASPLPAPPDNVVATPGTEKNTITFDASLGADSYNLYWKNSSPVTKLTGTKITGITSPYEHASLDPDLTYYYVVTAVEDVDESEDSAEVSASPLEDVPNTPTNFEVVISGSGDSEIVLSWDLMEYADYYDIYYSTSAGVTKESGTKIGNITDSEYSHQELESGTYYYVIYAVNEIGESVVSDEVNGIVYFDGKIFDHDDQAKLNLLQQYQKE